MTLDDALFAVEERPVAVQMPSMPGAAGSYAPQARYKAIVDSASGRVFSIVTRDYLLITNAEAVELGRQCFERVFGPGAAERMVFFNLITSEKKSYCHIDFTLNHAGGSRPTEWVAFLRVTNSYNRMRSLQFSVGVCRSICLNGAIFGKRSIDFRAPHARREVERQMDFHLNFDSIVALQAAFDGWMSVLRRTEVASTDLLPLVVDALQPSLEPRRWSDTRGKSRFAELRARTSDLGAQYMRELGGNAYAAFNLVSDFATRPVAGLGSAATVDRLQRRASEWAERLSEAAVSPSFSLRTYLAPCVARIDALRRELDDQR